jgi:Formyl transferase
MIGERVHVGIITYQTGHLKTWQLMRKMLAKRFTVTLFAFPFKARPPKRDAEPRFADRPFQLLDLDVPAFCAQHGVRYVPVDSWSDTDATRLDVLDRKGRPPVVYLDCIAKIIPPAFIAGRKILNCHPGLLPQNRGVDAFKWSIVNKWPVGVTLHVIDEQIDRGTILSRMRVPVLPNDDLATLCQRAYDFEVDLLGNFEHHLPNLTYRWDVGDDYPCSHKLIPRDQDQRLEDIFAANRSELCELSSDMRIHAHQADAA